MRFSPLILLLPLIFLLPDVLAAQDYNGPRTGYGISLFPHLANRRLAAANSISFEEIDRIEEREVAAFGYAAGLFFRNRSLKLGYDTGLNYLVSGYDTQRGPVDAGGPRPGFSEYSETFVTRQIELPFAIQFYQQVDDANEFSFSLGLAVSYALDQRTEYTGFNTAGSQTFEINEDVSYRAANYAFMAGFGYNRRFGTDWAVLLQPTFKYWFRGLIDDEEAELNRNLYMVGFKTVFMRVR
ncbi:MAG: outer membrane beta-barrel protein [Saprospiraceae bacterium]